MPQASSANSPDFEQLLDDVQTRERHRLQQRLRGARNAAAREQVLAAIEVSRACTEARLHVRGEVTLAPDLPVTARAEEIEKTIRAHQVVVVCGETGSGKTTQLPRILMRAGLGARGQIGHTQPRRLAARSVAQRIADEMTVPLGTLVGYRTRFDEKRSDDTQIQLMTDGILLAETARDPFLNRYEAIIIDEAHERTLNIDFLLGYLKRLLPKRPDLKLIVTSATIDPDRFSRFFDDAPIINVEGRSYPVTLRYCPADDNTDMADAIETAVHELWREGPGDILVFLPGERDIRDTERHLSRALQSSKFAAAEIVPLYARLTRSAQNRVFTPGNGRRIVLATNVAETSLTVPGIRYVIDSGLARISRYATTARVQRLPIEPVSQASCNQRSGRCGRVAPGLCIRLFGETDFDGRPEFTDPEIRRTNLANVLLTMADLRLGDIDRFPFIDAPQHRYIRDGRNLLSQLQAFDDGRITPLGRRMARLPLDPRIARMLLAGDKLGVLSAVRVVAAGLTIQDPRERPVATREQADKAHKAFIDTRSDFVSLLKLWDAFAEIKRENTGNQLRKWCRTHYLNFMRMREWEDLVRQLRRIGKQINLSSDVVKTKLSDCDYAQLHQALLPGLLDQFGRLDERSRTEKGSYVGARNRHFRIFPGSAVVKKTPRWLVAGELIETSRLYAHTVATIEPEWLENAAAHLIAHEYYEPHWSKRRGHTAARLRIRLFGQTLSEGRKVDFGRIDPLKAREIFIQNGLVEGLVTDRHGRLPAFLAHNRKIVEEISAREERFRRRDLLVDETTRAAFYHQVLPDNVRDRKTLLQWIRDNGDTSLRFDADDLQQHSSEYLAETDFPRTLEWGNASIALSYSFAPGAADDGVTLRLPLPMLNQFPVDRADWLVPGLFEEKLREYLKALPKKWRRLVVPVPDHARVAAEQMRFGQGNLVQMLRATLMNMIGTDIPVDAWREFQPSPHLCMRFEIVDAEGRVIDSGRDLQALRDALGTQAAATVQDLGQPAIQHEPLQDWPDTDFSQLQEVAHGAVSVQATPALVDEGDAVTLRLIDNPDKAERWHRQGVIRLLHIKAHKQERLVARDLVGFKPLAVLKLVEAPSSALIDEDVMASLQLDERPLLLADILQAVIVARMGDMPRTQAEFVQLEESLRTHIFTDANELWSKVKPVLEQWRKIRKRLQRGLSLDAMPLANDIQIQLDHLVFAGFVSHLRQPSADAKHLKRYMAAIDWRLDKIKSDGVAADKQRMNSVTPYWTAYQRHAEKARKRGQRPELLFDLRWMIEEYRVQIFAQPLGTAIKVSPKRLDAVLDQIKREIA